MKGYTFTTCTTTQMASQTTDQNITFGIAGKAALGSGRKYRDLSNHTVIIVSDDIMDDNLMKETANIVLSRGCKNIAFCGESSDDWRRVFEEQDREINGFNDITGYDDFAVMWGYEDIDDMAEGLSSCWNEVLILCSNRTLLSECKDALRDEVWV